MTHKSWGSTVSDTDSVGGGSGLGSPTTSTGTTSWHDYCRLNSHMYYIKDIVFSYAWFVEHKFKLHLFMLYPIYHTFNYIFKKICLHALKVLGLCLR